VKWGRGGRVADLCVGSKFPGNPTGSAKKETGESKTVTIRVLAYFRGAGDCKRKGLCAMDYSNGGKVLLIRAGGLRVVEETAGTGEYRRER